jgi:predicted GNAT family N-acyltransferase
MTARWQLVRLRDDHPVDAFTCGSRPGAAEIDAYLRQSARTEQAARLAAVWVVENLTATTSEERLVGFFTLSPVSVRLSPALLEAMDITAPYQMIGGWLLGRMGIAQQYRGREHGRRLVASAIRMAQTLSRATAGTLLAVDPANAQLMQWYLDLDFGFRRLAPNDSRMLRLAMKL